jgi:hypothetical protein
MKLIKNILAAAAVLSSAAAFSAANDAMVSFSTKGPDKYADGATVLDGECYALVWTAPNSAGLAVAADGTASGGEIVLAAPVAKGGRCPKVIFEVNADDMAKKYKGGSWSVLLLDTRRWGADGSVRPAGTVAGKVTLVNATGEVSGGSVNVATASSSSVSAVAAAVATATAVPEGTPSPTITGIRVEGANVFVSVKGTVPYLQYGLSSGSTPDAVTEGVSETPQTGASAPDEEIVLVAPAKSGGAFFKVGRK